MRHSISKDLFAYWNMLRGPRAAPERLDLDPSVIRSLLADTFILDHDSNHGYPFRLSGTRNNQLFDRELRLKPFLDLWCPQDKPRISQMIETVSDDLLPICASIEASSGSEPLSLEMLLLPLRHHGLSHSRLLGCLSPMTTPGWIGLRPIGPMKLNTFRSLEVRPFAPALATSLPHPRDHLPVFERRNNGFRGQRLQPRTLRHLTIYEGGR